MRELHPFPEGEIETVQVVVNHAVHIETVARLLEIQIARAVGVNQDIARPQLDIRRHLIFQADGGLKPVQRLEHAVHAKLLLHRQVQALADFPVGRHGGAYAALRLCRGRQGQQQRHQINKLFHYST